MRSILIALPVLALGACNMAADAQESGGPVARQDFQVGSFDRVALAGSQNVVVKVGGAPSVRAEGDAERIERLEIRVEDGTLRIGNKSQSWNMGWSRNRAPVTIYVTAPSLVSAAVAGSGDMQVDRVEGDSFTASIAGSGDLTIGAVRATFAEFEIAGSGDIKAAGSAERTKASIAGSGDIDISGLDSRQADVRVVGSGDVRAKASDTADVKIMGSGNVTVAGGARCTVSKKGSGELNCG